ncbi:phosphoglycerate mutase family protein [Salinarimonas soli]|uniref:Histidine phosphatase family protein n=1 Tax=Salinarimonas soli TaxID=1638099 RepID=A0A5B2V5F3_9HYPH|nr:phosphoglycerate mutase family protein [Salinarimonas soli]KAA2234753.1 histidine phosphatase family protein [Salinarimonas soli]
MQRQQCQAWRPFVILLSGACAPLVLPAPSWAQQAVIIVRHAEQTPTGGMMDGDPPLNEHGAKRAQALPERLRQAGIKAVYSSQYARSRETAEPLIQATSARTYVVPKDDMAALTAHIREHHANDVVAVVGHSDTIPAMLKAWGHPEPVEIGRAEFDGLWLVVPRQGAAPVVTRLRI